jgi:phage-related protein (TIGR01555 family)
MAKKRTMQDGLENLMTGMGTSADARTFTTFANVEIPQAQLDIAYRNDWIARKVIDLPAFDSTREWRDWQADKEEITKLEEAETKLNLQRKMMSGLQKARLYGGAAMVMGVGKGKPEEPLDIETVKEGDLKFVHVVSRYEITAGPIEQDIESEWYGEPQYYDRQPTGFKKVRLHPSRVVRLIGAERFDMLANLQWGDPVLQAIADAIKMCGTVSSSVAALVDEAKIDVISIPGLTDNISDTEYEGKLRARFGLAATAKSVYRMLLLDKEEEWQRITHNFSTLDDILKMYLLIVSGAADIPATRFLSQSPAGLSATGDSDIRNYYDRIKTEQKTVIQPTISRLDEVFIRSVLGTKPDGLHYTWNPLWQMDDKDSAEIAYKKAQVFKIDVDSGVMDPQVMRDARQNQLIEDGTYPGLEQTIEEFQNEMEDLSPDAVAAKAAEEQANALALAGAKGQPPGGGVPPKGGNVVPIKGKRPAAPVKKAVGDAMADRIRVALSDAQPRTLYVYRPVKNWKEIAKWAKANGIAVTVGKEMHVTLAYLMTMKAFTGEIVLGPEVFETVNTDYKEELIEDAKVGMVFGVRPIAAPPPAVAAMTANDVEKVVRTVIGDARPAQVPNITVPVTVHMPKTGKQVTKVTKRNSKGAIDEFEQSEE